MFQVFNTIDDLFNQIIKINNNNKHWLKNSKNCLIPISNKYFLTILNHSDTKVNNFFEFINDNTRTLEYPFKKNNDIDYSFIVEYEQFYTIKLDDLIINDLSKNIDKFYKITKESYGEIICVIDINLLLNNYLLSKNILPNHLIDFLIWKLKNKVSYIYIFDSTNNIAYNNMLYLQFKVCIKKFDIQNLIINKNISIYKKTSDTIFENIYWNLLSENLIITSKIDKKIKFSTNNKTYINESENNSLEFDIGIINNTESYITNINLVDIINNNIFETSNILCIIIDPIDRLNIYIN